MSTRSTKNVCNEEPLSPKLTEQLYYPKRESIRGFFSLDSLGTEGEGEGISPVGINKCFSSMPPLQTGLLTGEGY